MRMILLLGLARESRISPETTRFVGVSSSQATVLTGKHLPPRKKRQSGSWHISENGVVLCTVYVPVNRLVHQALFPSLLVYL